MLARLLAPSDFGLFGLVLLLQEILDAFAQTGLHSALIHRSHPTLRHLDTAWTIQLVRSLLIGALLFVTAPTLASLFGVGELAPLLQFTSLHYAVIGFENIGIVFFEKDLDLRRQFIHHISIALTTLGVGVALAYWMRSVWALILSSFAGILVRCVLSFVLHPYRPSVLIDRECARDLFQFGRWITASTAVGFIAQRIDSLVLARICGPGVLGIYRMAMLIATTLTTELRGIVTSTGFPVYAALLASRERAASAFLTMHEVLFSISVPASIVVAVLAEDVVYVVLGANWAAAVAPVRILALIGAVSTVDLASAPVFLGFGRPRLDFLKSVSRLAVLTLAIWPMASWWQASGAAVAVIVAALAAVPISLIVIRVLKITPAAVLRTTFPGLALGTLSVLLLGAVVSVLPSPGPIRLGVGLITSVSGWLAGLAAVAQYRVCPTWTVVTRLAGTVLPFKQ